jgi:N-6 DNA Methylase
VATSRNRYPCSGPSLRVLRAFVFREIEPMIDRQQLLADLKPLLREMEADLRARCDEVAQINADLMKEYEEVRAANRAGVTFEEWRADLITQIAVAWVLSSVFVRFLEDNALISPPRISGRLHVAGNGQGLTRARDERDLFFHSYPKQTDRDYLLAVFDALAKLPGTKDIFGLHNPVSAYRDWLSGDAARRLIEFFQKIDTDGTGEIIHDFTTVKHEDTKTRRTQEQTVEDPTRFLGDLYQDLSEAARKKYALLQTPIFVEEFILDRTLEPAIKEFGLKDLKMIDPACGSGHFVLGSFARILRHWRKAEPGTNERELVNRALASVHGVDLNPYAVAIARFRLLLAAMKECRITRLKEAPNLRLNLACGDSLLHGSSGQQVLGFHELAHHYQSENIDEVPRILKPGQYHAVVANPPYITVKDKSLNQAYRDRYPQVCHRQYSLAVPFMKRLFDLACENGFTGQITANSFMKREFGKKLVESYLPKVDLTHVIDTSGAYIPGHGTPTVILFGRQRKPVRPTIRTVMGIKGEPTTPADPSQGLVWSAILDQLDRVGSQSAFVSVNDTPRDQFARHPWSIGGGGAAELKEQLDETASSCLSSHWSECGFGVVTREDEAYQVSREVARRKLIDSTHIRHLVEGEEVRDWTIAAGVGAVWPYDPSTLEMTSNDALIRFLWCSRRLLSERVAYGLTQLERGLAWHEYSMFFRNRFRTPLSIVFAFVATHNHFVLDRGGKVFNRSAPVIKLATNATEDDHLALLGLLNSSTACFWMKQIFHNKGSTVDHHGARQRTMPFEDFWEHDGTKLKQFPLPADRPLALSRQLDARSQALAETLPSSPRVAFDVKALAGARQKAESLLEDMIAMQEELDWQSYGLYGLIPPDQTSGFRCENPPALKLGQRAFEIVLARKMEAGEEETTWFVRHGSTPITEIPVEWSEEYKQVIQRRIALIESDKNIALIERPEYKRRWNVEPWEQQQEKALRNWLLDRLEGYFDLDGRLNTKARSREERSGNEETEPVVPEPASRLRAFVSNPALVSVAKVADLAKQDKDFMQVAQLYAGRMDFDVANLVDDLIEAESVPCLPILRYNPTGLDKRAAWERTWDLQRLEDAVDVLFEELTTKARRHEEIKIDKEIPTRLRDFVVKEVEDAANSLAEAAKQNRNLASELILKPVTDAAKRAKQRAVGDIPVPPKYTSADFLSGSVWRLRGKLDVPKERWVSFPHCEGEDATLVIAWAGYDHLQLARAIAERYEQAKEREGRNLVPLLTCIGQLIPWLKQWYNELDPAFGTRAGDYFEGYLVEEAKVLGVTLDEVMAWRPSAKVNCRGRKRTKR